ncbi:hypothetical protein AAY473_011199, partial [Plecturocebus cupreus]
MLTVRVDNAYPWIIQAGRLKVGLLSSSGQRPGMLLITLQCTAHRPQQRTTQPKARRKQVAKGCENTTKTSEDTKGEPEEQQALARDRPGVRSHRVAEQARLDQASFSPAAKEEPRAEHSFPQTLPRTSPAYPHAISPGRTLLIQRRVQWLTPIIPALSEAKAGGSLEILTLSRRLKCNGTISALWETSAPRIQAFSYFCLWSSWDYSQRDLQQQDGNAKQQAQHILPQLPPSQRLPNMDDTLQTALIFHQQSTCECYRLQHQHLQPGAGCSSASFPCGPVTPLDLSMFKTRLSSFIRSPL